MIYYFTGKYQYQPNVKEFYLMEKKFEIAVESSTDEGAMKKLQTKIVSKLEVPVKKINFEYTFVKKKV